MSMKQLWAPWRMEFIKDPKAKSDDGCIFCSLVAENEDRKTLILHRGKKAFVILNKYPYNSGHLMIVPFLHVADYEKLPEADLNEMNGMAKHAVAALREAYAPEGFNMGMNLGRAAGAGIKDHLHLHVVPRWLGDTNFLPVVGETKSMPQHLETTYDALHGYFRRL